MRRPSHGLPLRCCPRIAVAHRLPVPPHLLPRLRPPALPGPRPAVAVAAVMTAAAEVLAEHGSRRQV